VRFRAFPPCRARRRRGAAARAEFVDGEAADAAWRDDPARRRRSRRPRPARCPVHACTGRGSATRSASGATPTPGPPARDRRRRIAKGARGLTLGRPGGPRPPRCTAPSTPRRRRAPSLTHGDLWRKTLSARRAHRLLWISGTSDADRFLRLRQAGRAPCSPASPTPRGVPALRRGRAPSRRLGGPRPARPRRHALSWPCTSWLSSFVPDYVAELDACWPHRRLRVRRLPQRVPPRRGSARALMQRRCFWGPPPLSPGLAGCGGGAPLGAAAAWITAGSSKASHHADHGYPDFPDPIRDDETGCPRPSELTPPPER